MKISKRLKQISNYIDNGSSIIDVGCDHALLDIYLENNKKLNKIIASDINEGPLSQAKLNLEKYNSKIIKLSLSDGLNDLEQDINTIIISGLGGESIISILYKDIKKLENIDNIIVSPNNEIPKVRKKISQLGYMIEKESYVLDKNKYYCIMRFIKGKKKYSKKELFFGPIALKEKNEMFQKYFEYYLSKEIHILSKLPRKHIIKRLITKMRINDIKQVLKATL